MYFGKVFTASPGVSTVEILAAVENLSGGGVMLTLYFDPHYTERYYAIFVNGRFLRTIYIGENPIITQSISANPAEVTSVYFEDIGLVSNPDPDLVQRIACHALKDMALTANRIHMDWTNKNSYTLTPVLGDNQLSNIQLTNAERNVNLTPFPERPTRARITYAIKKVGA